MMSDMVCSREPLLSSGLADVASLRIRTGFFAGSAQPESLYSASSERKHLCALPRIPELTLSGITDLRVQIGIEPFDLEGSCPRIVKLFNNNVMPSVALLHFPWSCKARALTPNSITDTAGVTTRLMVRYVSARS